MLILFQSFCAAFNTASFVADTSRWWAAGAAVFCVLMALSAIADEMGR